MNLTGLPMYQLDDMDCLWQFAKEVIAAKHETSTRYNWDGQDRRVIRNVEGYLAELAACEHYGTEFNWDVHERAGDAGFDLEVGGRLLGVKATSLMSGRLLVKHYELQKQPRPHAYLLVLVNIRNGVAVLRGIATVPELVNRQPKKMREDGPLNYVMEQSELKLVKGATRNETVEEAYTQVDS